ncbi:MAG: type II toxin-antitoxin system VapC family toxin [Proteobacteria bacterium]|nr:type II toxin-antitoxin system VapC family toxin [Pseudomonadota bacterium]
MIAIDTNILVRIFIDDLNDSQVKKSRDLAKKAKNVFLSEIVLVEMVWVLSRAYDLTKQQILAILQEIYENSAFVVEREQNFLEGLLLFRENNADFSDCMILVAAKKADVKDFYTFDEKFAKLKPVKKLA